MLEQQKTRQSEVIVVKTERNILPLTPTNLLISNTELDGINLPEMVSFRRMATPALMAVSFLDNCQAV